MATITEVINLTPKARFLQSSDNAQKHRDLVDSVPFQRGCDFTMLEMAKELANASNDSGSAIPAALMLRGAHEFLKIFRNLSEKAPELPQVAQTKGLNYKQ